MVSGKNAEIRRLVVEEGRTCQAVADKFGVSRQRVATIARGNSPRTISELRKNPPPETGAAEAADKEA